MNDDASGEQPVLCAAFTRSTLTLRCFFECLLVVGYGDGGVGVRV